MKINCIIVDDEPLARKGLTEYVHEVGFLDLKAECENSVTANEVLSQQKIDLIFLDIQMPKMTGVEFIKTLREPPMVIFTTAYSEYALESYELDVLDYLVKPISLERFIKSVNKAKEFYELKINAQIEHPKETNYFFVRCDNRYEKVLFDDLLFVQAMENYVIIQTRSKKLITYLTFKSVEEYLSPALFLKVHKSFIVSVSKVEKIEGNEIKMENYSIPISRNLKEDVMNKIISGKIIKR